MMYNNVTKIESKFSNIYLYYYENGIKMHKKIELVNYFYVKKEDKNKVIKLFNEFEYKFGEEKKSIYNDDVIKIIPNKFQFWRQRKLLWKNNIQTYESKIDVYLKFLLENEVNFTKDRRIGIIDIENDMSLDVDNTPVAITSICIYDYQTDKYYVWAHHKEKLSIGKWDDRKELNFYNDEKSMLKAFIKAFKNFEFDVMVGWNIENFDFPYIINRLKKLNFNVNELSNFSSNKEQNVECDKVIYNGGKTIVYRILIPGMDILDMIPIMKKANCYSQMPGSFSLNSTVKWYLKNEKKLDYGANSWKNNFKGFIDYNIQDVRLVKLLMNKYELMTFLYAIHFDMASGIPLNHCVHNSIVLIYKIKQDFPDIILPDNIRKFQLEKDNIIDLNETVIKIKAAAVTEPEVGIHENVISYDFAQLYPSIIKTFNISPDTLNDNGEIEIDDIEMTIVNQENERVLNVSKNFCNDEKGLYPQICDYLVNKRTVHKKNAMNAKEKFGMDSFEYKSHKYKDDSQKQVLNSLFGVGAYHKFEIYNVFVSAAITSIGRKLIMFINDYCRNKNYIPVAGDTDSCYIKVPRHVNKEDLGEELNNAIKNFILEKWPMVEKNYCLNFTYERTFKKFMIKSAKKKYFGIMENDDIYVKGFSLVQHSTPSKVKIFLEDIFKDLVNQKDFNETRKKLLDYKKEFKKMSVQDIAIELKLTNNPENYTTKVQHAEASVYANKHLGTNLKAGDICKFVYLKDVKKYIKTPYVAIEENTELPSEYIVDYDKMFDKLVLMPLKTLEELKELQIEKIISQERSLKEFGI